MDNYVYFGKRSHFSHLANTSSNLQKSDALTAANFGIVPANFTAGTSTDAVRGIEVFIVAKEANGSTRGTAVSALLDQATDTAFASPIATTAINDVSRMIWDAVGISSGVLTIANFGADGTNGYLIDAADQWIIREHIGSTNDALSDVPAIQQAGCFNMNRFRGCDPVDTSTAATIGVDFVKGTAGSYEVEKTKIIFDGGDGGATQDYVVLTHAANKFKDVCTAMETLRNGSYAKQGDGMYTFTDLMSGGKTFWDNELGIVGCHMVNTTL